MQEQQNLTTNFRILVVDDEEGMRLGVCRALEKYRSGFDDLECVATYSVDMAASGEEAVTCLESGTYDILLLDYKMPGMNGIEVLEKTAPHNRDMLVIMISAYASLDIAITATKQGAFDFLAKPFTPQELRATIRSATKNLVLQRRANRFAEEKRRVRFEFISVLSHELKAPIGAVEGYLNLIRNGTVKDEATLLKIVDRSIARLDGMRKLIFDILDLTRIESGQKKRHIQEINLSHVAADAVEMMGISATERGIAIELHAPESMPYLGDKGELDIVFNNLVSNAVKYNTDNGEVHVRLFPEDTNVVIQVSDTGIGMTNKEQEKLFGEFVRMKNAHTVSIEGSGLGLSTVKKIVGLYHGTIEVTSEWEKGTTFTVRLPAVEQEMAQSKNSDNGDDTDE